MSKVLTLTNEAPQQPTAYEKMNAWVAAARKIPDAEKIFFTKNLQVMLVSGLSAARAIETLAKQTQHQRFKKILQQCAIRVEQGDTIADALARYPRVFESIFVHMIRAGEASGQLEHVLLELTKQLKQTHELKSSIRGALLYPIIIVCAMVILGFAMVLFVIPKLLSIFNEVNVVLPLPTRMLIGLVSFLNAYAALLIPGLALAIAAVIWSLRHGSGRVLWHTVQLRLPIVGPIIKKVQLARIARTFTTLIKTSIPIVTALTLTANVIRHIRYHEHLVVVANAVEHGGKLSAAFNTRPDLYPPIMQQMVAVGEETGKLDDVLDDLAAFYEEDIHTTMKTLPSIIEPALIVFLGVVIGGMAVAILLPMFQLSDAF